MSEDTQLYTYGVAGMTCAGCTKKVAAALQTVPGVVAATVTLDPPEARLQTRGAIPRAELNQALARIGIYKLTETAAPAEGAKRSLYPLYLIVGFIAATVAFAARGSGQHSTSFLITSFMAGFFLVFSFFKFLDLRGFAGAYQSYDLLARAVPAWGWVYPFVEFALGAAFLLRTNPEITNVATLALMLFGSAGVGKTLLEKRKIRCACLGTVIQLPMTTVTLVEDLGMAAMAAAMLVLHFH